MKVLICAAGSGGHIYPALSLAKHLKASNESTEILFLSTTKAIGKKIFASNPYQVFTVDFISPFRAKGANPFKFCLKNLGFLLKFSKEAIKVFFLLLKTKPDVVVGFGGIISVAAIIFSRLQGIPTLIHEQNVVPGLANRFISKMVTKVAIGFKKSSAAFGGEVAFTGNPLRPDIEKIDKSIACNKLGLSDHKFTIFILGGSQGSEFVNKNFIKAIEKLNSNLKDKLQIIHSTGIKDKAQITAFYKKSKLQSEVYSYCTEMSEAYSAADLVIGRSGAGIINEVCFFGKPAIFIPYQYASGHQKANARFMQENGAACLLQENELMVEHFAEDITRLIQQQEILNIMAKKSSELFVAGAGQKLADLVLDISKSKNKN